MPAESTLSQASRGEDVILLRTFLGAAAPTFVEVSAGSGPTALGDALRAAGWTGTTVAEGASLSAVPEAVDVLVVHAPASATLAAAGVDATALRPRAALVGVTGPGDDTLVATLTDLGYHAVQHDGGRVFLVRGDQEDELGASLSEPAGPGDWLAISAAARALAVARSERDEARAAARAAQADLARWQAHVIEQWSDALALAPGVQRSALAESAAAVELEAMRRTLSWRVTRPLRTSRTVASRARRLVARLLGR